MTPPYPNADPETLDQLEQLAAMSALLNQDLPTDTVLQHLSGMACQMVGAEAAFVLVLDDFTESLHFEGLTENYTNLKGLSVALSGSAAGQALRNQKPIVLNGEAAVLNSEFSQTDVNVKALLALPLVSKGRPLGALEVINPPNGAFTDGQIALLTRAAQPIAAAVGTARILDRLANTSREVEALDRMKRNFTAIVQHELRTPLGLILGYVSFLREMVDEEMQEQFDVVMKAALRLKEITEDLTAIAHIDQNEHRLEREALLVSDLLQAQVDRAQAKAAAKNITVSMHVPEPPPFVYADWKKTEIVLNNLVDNALQFTMPDGHITLVAEDERDMVKISVGDTGIGIPVEEHKRIFQRFYQVDSPLTRTHGGMGLGLSIARAIIDAHGGQIVVESTPGAGSTFSVLLAKPRNI